jgi:hypothetical protein
MRLAILCLDRACSQANNYVAPDAEPEESEATVMDGPPASGLDRRPESPRAAAIYRRSVMKRRDFTLSVLSSPLFLSGVGGSIATATAAAAESQSAAATAGYKEDMGGATFNCRRADLRVVVSLFPSLVIGNRVVHVILNAGVVHHRARVIVFEVFATLVAIASMVRNDWLTILAATPNRTCSLHAVFAHEYLGDLSDERLKVTRKKVAVHHSPSRAN